MARLDGRLTNAADEWSQSLAEWRKMTEAWEQATEAIELDSSARRKSETVRQVIEKIIVTFEPTGKKSPLGRVKSIEVVPHTPNTCGKGDLRPCELEYPRK